MVTTLNNVVPTLDLGRAITEAVRLPITAFDAGKTRIVIGLPPRAVVVGGQVIVRDIFNGTSPQVKVGYSNFTTDTDLTAFGTVPLTATGSTLIGPAASGGFPDATTTGPAAGTVFTPFSGTFQTTSNGQVVEKLNITGTSAKILIKHSGVTIRDCIITSDEIAGINCQPSDGSLTAPLIERVRMTGIGGTSACILIESGAGAEIRYCDLSGFENGILIGGNAQNIHDNYIHDLISLAGTPHVDGIQGTGGFTSLTVRHNTIVSWDTSCVIMQNEGGGFSGLVIDNNRLLIDQAKGGSFGIRVGSDKSAGAVSNVSITNNRIQKGPGGGTSYIYLAGTIGAPKTVTGNVDDVTGAAVVAEGDGAMLLDAPEVMATTARTGAVSVVATVEGTNITAGSADIIIKFMSY
jgi:hypothetical protein